MLQKLREIWTDPVWSKVLSAIILAVGSMFWSESREFLFQNWWIFLVIVFVLIIYWQYDDRKKLRQKLNAQHFETDKETYRKAQSLLTDKGLMQSLRSDNFLGPFNNDIFLSEDIMCIKYVSNPIEYEFFDAELNELFTEVLSKTQTLISCLAENTFGVDNNYDFSHIAPEWKHKLPDKYQEAVSKINECQTDFCKAYDEFCRKGKYMFGHIS